MKILFFLILSSFALLCTPKVLAADFDTQMQATYTVGSDGNTTVEQKISIRNLTSTVQASQYALEVGTNRVTDLIVESNGKKLTPTVTSLRNKTSIRFRFDDKVVGRDQVREVLVRFQSPDIAVQLGDILEVSIPKLATPEIFSRYTIRLVVNEKYGVPSYATPSSFTTSSEEKENVFTFEDFGQGGIRVVFGTEQYATGTLRYNLENPSNVQGKMIIAFPSDTQNQRIIYERIDPLPQSITVDSDGNWLGEYTLEPNEKKSVTATFSSIVAIEPLPHANYLARAPLREHRRSQPFWETDDPVVRRAIEGIQSPQDIYAFVVRTLVYDPDRDSPVNRVGAAKILEDPSRARCQDFTDLFVTLSRARGVASRGLIGYAYTQNAELRPVSLRGDTLHAWPEFHDEVTDQWVQVDPTWEDTTGGVDYFNRVDLNRITFVKQGVESSLPLPAGMYKFGNSDAKDVVVQFGTKKPVPKDSFSTALRLAPRSFLRFQDRYRIDVTNRALHAVYGVPVRITVTNTDGVVELDDRVTLLPLGTQEFPVQLPHRSLFSRSTTTVTVRVGDQAFSHEISIRSTITQIAPFLVTTTLVGGTIGVCAIITRRLLVPRWRR